MVLRGKFIALNEYIRKGEKHTNNNLRDHFKKLEKESK